MKTHTPRLANPKSTRQMTARRVFGMVAVLLSFAAIASANPEALAKAQALLDDGRPRAALEVVQPLLKKGKNKSPQALLIRSTAQIMLGSVRSGFEDLELALQLDPTLRQGWLNLAGLEIAEHRYEAAKTALLKAQQLDLSATDNWLNLGAVEILLGNISEADKLFATYIEATDHDAEAYYQVASNYSLAHQEEKALAHLEQAILADERVRMRARTDDRFLLLNGLRLQAVLAEDRYQPPAGAHRAMTAFSTPYSQQDTRFLYAVVHALQSLGEPYDTSIEATIGWAIIWGDLRIKLSNQKDGTGLLQVSAPSERMDAAEWQRRTNALFAAVYNKLSQS